MHSPHLLLVEDEPAIRTPLKRFLEREGFRVTDVGDSGAARIAIDKGKFALAILDIMLPGEDGLSLARWIRANDSLPVIFLSARSEDVDRIVGLEMGADDYLAKPFNPRELLARIRAILRRAETPPTADCTQNRFLFGEFVLDSSNRCLKKGDEDIPLTSGEYSLLLTLVERAGRTLNRDQLVDMTRGREAYPFDRSIDNAVLRLRKKLGAEGRQLIATVHGLGYSFTGKVIRQ